MLKRAERELERVSVNAPKVDLIIDHLRAAVAAFRSILVIIANLNPDEYMAGNPKLYQDDIDLPKKPRTKVANNPASTPVKPPELKPAPPVETEKVSKKRKSNTATGKWDAEKEQFLLENYTKMSPYMMGKALGLSSSTILHHLKRLGLRDSLEKHASGGED